jgi:hypothetical protein
MGLWAYGKLKSWKQSVDLIMATDLQQKNISPKITYLILTNLFP